MSGQIKMDLSTKVDLSGKSKVWRTSGADTFAKDWSMHVQNEEFVNDQICLKKEEIHKQL